MGQAKEGCEVAQVMALSALVAVLGWWFFDSLWFFLAIPVLPALFWRADHHDQRPGVRQCPWCGFETCDPAIHKCPKHGRALTHAEA